MKQFKMLVSKLAIALIVFAAIIAKTAVPAFADGEDMIVIYAQVPGDWEKPCVWAWDDDGNSAFDMWPGGEMDEDKDNEGWSYVYIPSWANHIIINANGGEVQADEIILKEAVNTWVSIAAPDDVTVTTDQATKGDIPEYVEKFPVHVRVDESWGVPHIQAVLEDGAQAFEDTLGKEMSLDATDWYTASIPVTAKTITVLSEDGKSQTEDIKIDAAQVWVSVEADGTYDFSYVDPEKAAAPNIKIYAIAPSEWEKPCLWAWSAPDGTGVYTTWPGEAFEEDESGWLVKEVPGWVNSIIVNANDGTVQTADISIDAGVDVWVVVTDKDTYEVYYDEPEGVVDSAKAAGSDAGDSEDADTTKTGDTEAASAGASDGQEVAGAKRDGGNTSLPIVGGLVGAALVAAAGTGTYMAKKRAK